MIACLRSRHLGLFLPHEEVSMQLTDLEEIKAVLWLQACHGCTQVQCPLGQVMAVRRSKGHLLALLCRRGRWYEVDAVAIERPRLCPTGAYDLGEDGAGITRRCHSCEKEGILQKNVALLLDKRSLSAYA